MRIIRSSDCRVMPWKNGGGTTTEIAVHPPGAGLGDFMWRVSMASVATDGPFSAFPGIDRTLTILTGEGIRLTVGETPAVELTPVSDPLAFKGDVPASATLIAGPVTDLNVMTRRGKLKHRVMRLVWPVHVKPSPTSIVFCHRGTCAATVADERLDLEPGDTAIVENEAFRLAPASGGSVYLIEIAPA